MDMEITALEGVGGGGRHSFLHPFLDFSSSSIFLASRRTKTKDDERRIPVRIAADVVVVVVV